MRPQTIAADSVNMRLKQTTQTNYHILFFLLKVLTVLKKKVYFVDENNMETLRQKVLIIVNLAKISSTHDALLATHIIL